MVSFLPLVAQTTQEGPVELFGVIIGLGVAIIIGSLHYARGNVGAAVWLGGTFGLMAGCFAATLYDNGQKPVWILLGAFCLAAVIGIFTSSLE